MVDDYKYSVGRSVVYRHPNPTRDEKDYGQYGPVKTIGVIRSVEGGKPPESIWVYTIENLRTTETVKVPENDVLYGAYGRGPRLTRELRIDPEQLAQDLATDSEEESPLAAFLRMNIEEHQRREETEEQSRREGRDLPIQVSDYIRVRGELRSEVETAHNHYAKILEVRDPEVGAIESRSGHYAVRREYRILIDDGREMTIYDPEVKFYYTAEGRRVILNWKAATFLAESFGDDPPYSLEYSYLEDHVFSREELERKSRDELMNLFAALLYVKGRMGLRDLQNKDLHLAAAPREYLVDSILAMSRFDMRKNRSLTPHEVDRKIRDVYRLRRLLR